MTSDTSARYCGACGASATLDANYCVACGLALQPRAVPRSLAPTEVRVVEAEPEATPPAIPASAGDSALAALSRLAVVAWRQPAVRSAVKTGASAVALSLVWRLAGSAFARGRARRMLISPTSEGLAPMIGDALREATPGKRLRRRGRRGEVVEEVVYIRRIFRR